MATANEQALQQVMTYLSSVGTATAALQNDATQLTNVPQLTLTNQQEVQDVQQAYNAIYSGALSPSTAWSVLQTVLTSLQQIDAQVATQTQQLAAQAQALAAAQAQVASLSQQLAAKSTPTSIVQVSPATPATPPPMSTTTFVVGVIAVMGIGAGAWYVAKQAKTKAKEGHAAVALKKKAIAEAASESEEEAPARRATRYQRRR